MEPVGANASLERMRRILTERGIDPDHADGGSAEGPGDPAWHHARRVEIALNRWRAATPPRYHDAVADHPDVTAWAAAVADAPTEATSLLLLGPTGTGKTHQAFGAARRVAEAGQPGWSMVATTAADLYASLRPGSTEDRENVLQRAMRTPLLLLDDLGSAKASEWTEEVTYRLVNYRYNRLLPTLITTNATPRALANDLGERIASRLAEMTNRVVFKGTDRRRGSAA